MKYLLMCAILLAGCVHAPHPVVEALADEFFAYRTYVESEYKAGRITKEHGNYLIETKKNEVLQRAGALNASSSRSIYTPVRPLTGPRSVHCSSTTTYGTTETTCN